MNKEPFNIPILEWGKPTTSSSPEMSDEVMSPNKNKPKISACAGRPLQVNKLSRMMLRSLSEPKLKEKQKTYEGKQMSTEIIMRPKRGRPRKNTQAQSAMHKTNDHLTKRKPFKVISQNVKVMRALKEAMNDIRPDLVRDLPAKDIYLVKATPLINHIESTVESWEDGSGPLLERSDACQLLQQTKRLVQALDKRISRIRAQGDRTVVEEYSNAIEKVEGLYLKIDESIRVCDRQHMMEFNQELFNESDSESQSSINEAVNIICDQSNTEVKPILKYSSRIDHQAKVKLSFSEHSVNIYDDHVSQIPTKLDSGETVNPMRDDMEIGSNSPDDDDKPVPSTRESSRNQAMDIQSEKCKTLVASQRETLKSDLGNTSQVGRPDVLAGATNSCFPSAENNNIIDKMDIENCGNLSNNILKPVNKLTEGQFLNPSESGQHKKRVLYNPEQFEKKLNEEIPLQDLNKSDLWPNVERNNPNLSLVLWRQEGDLQLGQIAQGHRAYGVAGKAQKRSENSKQAINRKRKTEQAFDGINTNKLAKSKLESDVFSFDEIPIGEGKSMNFKTFKKKIISSKATDFGLESKQHSSEVGPSKQVIPIDQTVSNSNITIGQITKICPILDSSEVKTNPFNTNKTHEQNLFAGSANQNQIVPIRTPNGDKLNAQQEFVAQEFTAQISVVEVGEQSKTKGQPSLREVIQGAIPVVENEDEINEYQNNFERIEDVIEIPIAEKTDRNNEYRHNFEAVKDAGTEMRKSIPVANCSEGNAISANVSESVTPHVPSNLVCVNVSQNCKNSSDRQNDALKHTHPSLPFNNPCDSNSSAFENNNNIKKNEHSFNGNSNKSSINSKIINSKIDQEYVLAELSNTPKNENLKSNNFKKHKDINPDIIGCSISQNSPSRNSFKVFNLNIEVNEERKSLKPPVVSSIHKLVSTPNPSKEVAECALKTFYGCQMDEAEQQSIAKDKSCLLQDTQNGYGQENSSNVIVAQKRCPTKKRVYARKSCAGKINVGLWNSVSENSRLRMDKSQIFRQSDVQNNDENVFAPENLTGIECVTVNNEGIKEIAKSSDNCVRIKIIDWGTISSDESETEIDIEKSLANIGIEPRKNRIENAQGMECSGERTITGDKSEAEYQGICDSMTLCLRETNAEGRGKVVGSFTQKLDRLESQFFNSDIEMSSKMESGAYVNADKSKVLKTYEVCDNAQKTFGLSEINAKGRGHLVESTEGFKQKLDRLDSQFFNSDVEMSTKVIEMSTKMDSNTTENHNIRQHDGSTPAQNAGDKSKVLKTYEVCANAQKAFCLSEVNAKGRAQVVESTEGFTQKLNRLDSQFFCSDVEMSMKVDSKTTERKTTTVKSGGDTSKVLKTYEICATAQKSCSACPIPPGEKMQVVESTEGFTEKLDRLDSQFFSCEGLATISAVKPSAAGHSSSANTEEKSKESGAVKLNVHDLIKNLKGLRIKSVNEFLNDDFNTVWQGDKDDDDLFNW